MLGVSLTRKTGDATKAPTSGLEAMLRSMGLGEIIEAAKVLASNGTVEKILKFADSVDELNKKLDGQQWLLIALAKQMDIDVGQIGNYEYLTGLGTGGSEHSAASAPRRTDDAGAGHDAATEGELAPPAPAKRGAHRKPATSGAASGDADAGHGGGLRETFCDGSSDDGDVNGEIGE